VIAKTNPILAILEPTTLLIAIADAPCRAAFRLTKSSGTEVANETIVNPITILGSLSLKERPTDALTRYSPPITKKIKPRNIKKNSIR
jgi:hypothetical protein